MLYCWAVRELEIEHPFADGNGRASHLALLSMIAGDQDLPMFLFPDPNIFDANGPESVASHYLKACVNFREEGQKHRFIIGKKKKNLTHLILQNHPDLEALRDELMTLIRYSWRQQWPTPFYPCSDGKI